MGGVDYTVDDSEVQRLLAGVIQRLGHARPAMEVIGEIGLTSIQRNFETGGRPRKWPALKQSTIKQRKKKGRWPGRMLVRQGVSGGLLGSISYEPFSNKVVFSAGKEYAAIHHFGGQAGRGRKVTIPARAYMLLQDEDWKEIKAALNDFIFRG